MKKLDLFGSSSPFSISAVIAPDDWKRADEARRSRDQGHLTTREAHLKAIQEGTVAKR